MDKAAIITALQKYASDPNLRTLGAKMVKAQKEELEKGKKL